MAAGLTGTAGARWAALPLLLATLAGCTRGVRPSPALATLRIIATNDFHGGLEARRSPWGAMWGGAAAMAGVIEKARAECAPPSCYSILLDAGDEFQGQAASTLARGQPVSEIFNYLRYDAAALGNHDLDWGRDTLRLRMRDEHYSVLSANLRYVNGRPVEWIAPDTILHRGPFTIGVIGYMTVAGDNAVAASNLAGMTFVDPVAIVDSLARDLRRRGANVVVVLAHAGAECDDTGRRGCHGEILEQAAAFHEPIDAVIAGHRHLYVNTTVNGIPVTEARTGGQAVDVVDLKSGHTLARAEVRDVYVDSVRADPVVADMVKRAVAGAGEILRQRIATLADEMPNPEHGESAVGDLLADAMRAAGHADLAAMNQGGVRAGLHRGPVTYAELFELQPFGNSLVLIRSNGANIRRYLERMVQRGDGVRALISGATVTVDMTRAPGGRVQRVVLDSGRELNDSQAYTIVINNFMETGGDDLAFADPAARHEELPRGDLDATIDYLRSRPQPVAAPIPDRWRFRP